MSATKFPVWMRLHESKAHCVIADPDLFYPQILKDLACEKPDQYWLEVAYNFMKLDVQTHLAKAGIAAPENGCLTILVQSPSKSSKVLWARENHPPGRARLASDKQIALESRDHYKRLRGVLPG